MAQDSVERWKGKVPTEVSLFLLPFFLELAPQRPGVLFHRFMYGEEGNGWFYDELFARGVSEDTIRLRNEIWGSSLLTRVFESMQFWMALYILAKIRLATHFPGVLATCRVSTALYLLLKKWSCNEKSLTNKGKGNNATFDVHFITKSGLY